ncbi:MAG: ABC transporter substrate-binding protein [Elstera sp.]|jgi:iron(III) transport system substrate-binding protein|uniref:ABC transporter substrate-binding protein n=1 Tax=Elstera sp. TaxID=1916664 RepID=UPI0037BF83AE
MTISVKISAAALLLGSSLFVSVSAQAAGALTVYCGVQEEWCQAMAVSFQRTTGIQVALTRKSAGETLAQVRAESNNPKADIWWGGPGDPQLQASEEGLLQAYESPMLKELHPWAVSQFKQSKGKSVGIYAGALGFIYNVDELKKRNIAAPKCWSDLLRPEFKAEVQAANPNSSGTAYTTLATLVQLFGEDDGFSYMKKLHPQMNQYTKSGIAPANAAARGETLVGIIFIHDGVTQKINGFPVDVATPCEGTGYEIGSMSIINGAKNLDSAKKWYDWALTPAAQEIAGQNKSYQVPSNKKSPIPPEAPRLSDIRLIDYNFQKYGTADERKRLLTRWDNEIRAASN